MAKLTTSEILAVVNLEFVGVVGKPGKEEGKKIGFWGSSVRPPPPPSAPTPPFALPQSSMLDPGCRRGTRRTSGVQATGGS